MCMKDMVFQDRLGGNLTRRHKPEGLVVLTSIRIIDGERWIVLGPKIQDL